MRAGKVAPELVHAGDRSRVTRVWAVHGTIRMGCCGSRCAMTGSAVPIRGRGLVGINDRVTALAGQLRVDSPAGGGTVLTATLPLFADGGDNRR